MTPKRKTPPTKVPPTKRRKVTSPATKDVRKGGADYPLGLAALYGVHLFPQLTFTTLQHCSSSKARWRALQKLRHDFRTLMRTETTAQKFKTNSHNASDDTSTGPNYFAFFWVETALKYDSITVLQSPPDSQLVLRFTQFLSDTNHHFYRPFNISKVSSAKTYLESTLRHLKVIANHNIGTEPQLKRIRDDWQRTIDSQRSAKIPMTRGEVMAIYYAARHPKSQLIAALPASISNPRQFLRTWSTQMLLMYLGILRFCEAGHTKTSMVDSARLMSWGKHIQFFALKAEYKWIRDERMIMSQRNLTRDVDLHELIDAEVDGIDIVWRPGTFSKGEKGKAVRHTRTTPIWNPRWDTTLPAIATELKELFAWQKQWGAAKGTPVFVYECGCELKPITNGLFNNVFKLAGGSKSLSAKQLRSGGKTNATYAEWEADIKGFLTTTTLIGRWRSAIGNSDTYEKTQREPCMSLAERMMSEKPEQRLTLRETLAKYYFLAETVSRQSCTMQ